MLTARVGIALDRSSPKNLAHESSVANVSVNLDAQDTDSFRILSFSKNIIFKSEPLKVCGVTLRNVLQQTWPYWTYFTVI